MRNAGAIVRLTGGALGIGGLVLALATGIGRALSPTFPPPGTTLLLASPQRICLLRRGGWETLILQPTVQGNAREFGLLIPVPAAPQWETVGRDFFDQLEQLTQPQMPSWVSEASEGFLSQNGMSEALPELSAQWERHLLRANSAEAVGQWLTENGFTLPPNAGEVFDFYLQKGWLFAALRVRLEEEVAEGSFQGRLPPLGLTFPTAETVLPLRTASLLGETLELTLYTVAEGRMDFSGGRVMYANVLTAGDLTAYPALRQFLQPKDYVTKFYLPLVSAAVSDDLYLRRAVNQSLFTGLNTPLFNPNLDDRGSSAGRVDGFDLAAVARAWRNGTGQGDVNGDGVVNQPDVDLVVVNFGDRL